MTILTNPSFRTLALTLCLVSGTTLAQDSNHWLVRAGAAWVNPNDDSSEVSGIANSGVSVEDSLSLGLSLTYLYEPSWGVELLAAWPFEHEVRGEGSIAGLGEIATVKHLPPTLSLQYYFQPSPNLRPYLGVGLNYTTFFDEDASNSLESALGGPTKVSLEDSWGLAASGGVDYDIDETWFANVSAWYIDIDSTAKLTTGGTVRTVDVQIDPWVVMVGVGRRF